MLLQCEYLTYVRVSRLVHTSCNFCYSLGPTIVRIENFLSVLKRSGPLCVPQLVVASLNDPLYLLWKSAWLREGVKQCWFLTSDPLAPTPRHQHAVALSTNSTQQVRIPKKVLHLIGLRPSSLDEWAIGRMASWLIIKQSTDCKSLNLIYTFMFWKWSIIYVFATCRSL